MERLMLTPDEGTIYIKPIEANRHYFFIKIFDFLQNLFVK